MMNPQLLAKTKAALGKGSTSAERKRQRKAVRRQINTPVFESIKALQPDDRPYVPMAFRACNFVTHHQVRVTERWKV